MKYSTSSSKEAGSISLLNLARDPKISGADQCLACDNGLPRTSKLRINKKLYEKLFLRYDFLKVWYFLSHSTAILLNI